MEDEKQIELDRQRAEVFDALGHPTRIQILKVLSEGTLGFADLKKKTTIESSGHLQHHLTKLNGLIRTDEYGKYCLSEQGKDALLTVQTVENSSPRTITQEKGTKHFKLGLKPVAILLIALLIASSAVALYEFNNAAIIQEKFNRANSLDLEAMAYYSEFGVIPTTNTNSSYTPPISMYKALQTALEAEGLNKTILNGMNIDARLTTIQTATNGTFSSMSPLINIPTDYSDVHGNGIIYQYAWEITVSNASRPTYMRDFIFIHASTGQILPNPPLSTDMPW
jgi:DNA-binding HxlR family transcriptional regulator